MLEGISELAQIVQPGLAVFHIQNEFLELRIEIFAELAYQLLHLQNLGGCVGGVHGSGLVKKGYKVSRILGSFQVVHNRSRFQSTFKVKSKDLNV